MSGPTYDLARRSAVITAATGRVAGGPLLDLWASCPAGAEPLAAAELAALGWFRPNDADPPDGGALHHERGSVHGRADLAVVYRTLWAARTITRVCSTLATTDVDGLDELRHAVEALDLTVLPPGPFAVQVRRSGSHGFRSPDIARVAGAAVIDAYRRATGTRLPVDLDAPTSVVRVELDDRRLRVGVELTAGSLHRHPWTVAPHRAGLTPNLAAALLLLAGWQADEQLVDPMVGGGTIPIEALDVALARVDRLQCVVTNPPYGVRLAARSGLDGLYTRLLRAASARLTCGGRVTPLAPSSDLVRRAAAGTGLAVSWTRRISRGSLQVAMCRLDPT